VSSPDSANQVLSPALPGSLGEHSGSKSLVVNSAFLSIMVLTGNYPDKILLYFVNQPMFFGNPSAPAACVVMF
jgi:hypothetical protein